MLFPLVDSGLKGKGHPSNWYAMSSRSFYLFLPLLNISLFYSHCLISLPHTNLGYLLKLIQGWVERRNTSFLYAVGNETSYSKKPPSSHLPFEHSPTVNSPYFIPPLLHPPPCPTFALPFFPFFTKFLPLFPLSLLILPLYLCRGQILGRNWDKSPIRVFKEFSSLLFTVTSTKLKLYVHEFGSRINQNNGGSAILVEQLASIDHQKWEVCCLYREGKG